MFRLTAGKDFFFSPLHLLVVLSILLLSLKPNYIGMIISSTIRTPSFETMKSRIALARAQMGTFLSPTKTSPDVPMPSKQYLKEQQLTVTYRITSLK